MPDTMIHTQSGKTLDDLNMENLRKGRLRTEDFRISADTLRQQAEAAEAAGYPQVAENFRRAAELTHISNEEVLDMYTMLRPGRTTYTQLIALAQRLENDLHAPLTSAMVREAAEVYLERGLVEET